MRIKDKGLKKQLIGKALRNRAETEKIKIHFKTYNKGFENWF